MFVRNQFSILRMMEKVRSRFARSYQNCNTPENIIFKFKTINVIINQYLSLDLKSE